MGGLSRFGSTPCRDQRFDTASNDVRGGCSFDPEPRDDTEDQDELTRPSRCGGDGDEPTPFGLRLGLRLGLGLNLGLDVVEGEVGEGEAVAESAGDVGRGDRKALPLCRTPSVSAALAFVWWYAKSTRSPFV